MKKYFLIPLLLSFLFCSCSNLNGPERHVSIENQTDVEQNITLIINDSREQSYKVPAHDTIYTTITGGFKVKKDLDYKYDYTFTAENCVLIINSQQIKKTVINNLSVDVTLLDNNVSDFTLTLPANSTSVINVYDITHNYYLENQKKDGDILYIENNNIKYFFEIKTINNTIFISSL